MTASSFSLSRRRLLAGAAGCVGVLATEPALPADAAAEAITSESLAARLHASLSPEQRRQVCFAWDHVHPKFGLLRTRVGNNWNATEPDVAGDFFTKDQRRLIREIFEGLIEPDWHARFDKQLEDDTGGFGHGQSIALIGEPGSGKFQFLLTGRHMTLRCDGDSAEHVAFGGPIFYGHDAGGFNEKKDHPGNVFWPQAVAANRVFAMLDGKQQAAALVDGLPRENAIGFRARGERTPGIPVTALSPDQRTELEQVLAVLLAPYRTRDRDEVRGCLAKQGGLEGCRLAFYREGDIGNDRVWDNWRLEGPAFVWHFRGAPHVHVWVNIADSPDIVTNA
ncbi:MAG: DUF3500 domain-containing protein [Planctomycetota bacterium]|jgi:hypothetical protein|nr:MAG: DUF3500 domain-containing protein [Planctomycetota bacterium]